MNFGQAAERLNIAQPGLSQQVKLLERIAKVTLFDRSRRDIRLTVAGEMLARDARAILDHADAALLTAQRAARGEIGNLSIGYVASAAYTGVLTRLVGAFRDTYPEVEIAIEEAEMQQQLDALAAGQLDLGFVRPPVLLPEGVATIPIMMEEVALLLRSDHPQAVTDPVSLETCCDDVFITPRHRRMVSFSDHTLRACNAAGFEPRLGPMGRDFVTIASMVSIGLGIAIVPRSVECIRMPGLAYRSIRGAVSRAELAVAYRRGDASTAVRNFITLTRQFAKETLI